MNIDVELIEKVVKKVLNDVETGSSERRIWIWYL